MRACRIVRDAGAPLYFFLHRGTPLNKNGYFCASHCNPSAAPDFVGQSAKICLFDIAGCNEVFVLLPLLPNGSSACYACLSLSY